MKELSIEEKAKAYDEAYKVAKNIHIFSSDLAEIKRMEEIFPELKEESKGERIKKKICKLLWDNAPYEEAQEYITWLEKQGKEEYALKSFKDEDVRKFMQYIEKQAKAYEFNLPNRGYDIYAFAKDLLVWLEKQGEQMSVIEMKTPEESLGIDSDTYNKIVDECIYDEQKPAALNEEDEVKINRIAACLENLNVADNDILLKDVDWLKSLRPQNTWKPSDEQIGVIEAVINNRSFQRRHLDSLYEQLKKLKG